MEMDVINVEVNKEKEHRSLIDSALWDTVGVEGVSFDKRDEDEIG
jgi:hypothetical protein